MGPDPATVRIQLEVGRDGIVRRLDASGHAGEQAAGTNLVCAAISVLLRSVYETCARYDGVDIEAVGDQAGAFGFALSAFPAERADSLRALSDLLLVGLDGLSREHPRELTIVIEYMGGSNGT